MPIPVSKIVRVTLDGPSTCLLTTHHPARQVLYYLSGLTCTDDNVMQKSGVQRIAAELGVAVIAPDTSPRGLGIEGEDESWDFGTGAGFYLNATQEKWRQYRMYEYVVKELPMLLTEFSDLDLSKVRSAWWQEE